MKKLFALLIIATGMLLWSADSDLGKMPDFSLENAAGQEISLYSTLNDSTVVIVDFWATWCGPCCQELPHLDSLHNKYPNLKVLAITTDGRRTMQKAKDYIKDKGYNFTILMDYKRQVQRLLKVDAIPVTFIVRPNGEIQYKHVGYKPGDEKELEAELLNLLSELELN